MSMTEIKKKIISRASPPLPLASARIGDHHLTRRVDKLADKKIGSRDVLTDRRPGAAEVKGRIVNCKRRNLIATRRIYRN